MYQAGNYRQAMSNMQALAFIYDNLSGFPTWVQRLTAGQMEQLAAVLTHWQHENGERDTVQPLEDVEKREVMRALALRGGDVCAAAKDLHVGKTTLYRRLKGWGLTGSNWRAMYQSSALSAICTHAETRSTTATAARRTG